MAVPAGKWMPSTLTGSRSIEVDGVTYGIPEHADVKLVDGSGYQFGHVRHGQRVAVLCRLGQLVEDDNAARSRALSLNWREVAKY